MSETFTRRALCVVAFAVPMLVYVFSLTPGVGFWDTAEMQTVPYILGIAHPTGFPLFILLGYAFSHLVVIGNVAWRLSLMSATAMAGAAWFIFLTLRDEGVEPAIGCFAAWTFAFGSVAWTRATRAEVHALVIMLIAAATWAALRARKTGDRRPLFLCAFFLGLAAATHPVMIWTLPGVAVLLFAPPIVAWRYGGRNVILALAAGLAPLLLYLYIPARSAYVASHALDPTQALGLPPSQAFWNWGHPVGLRDFASYVLGSYYAKSDSLSAILHPTLYPSMAQTFALKVYGEFSIVAIALIVIGIVFLFFKDLMKACGFVLIALVGVPFALSYVVETDPDRYFLTAYWMLALLLGYGAQAIVADLKRRSGGRLVTSLVTLILCLNAGYTVYENRATFAQTGDHAGDEFVARTARQTPDGSIVVASWVYAAPLAYGRYVEGNLGQRIIVSAEPDRLAEFVRKWQRTRPVFAIYFKPLGDRVASLDGLRLTALQGDAPTIYRVGAQSAHR
ncbi:MAG: DUF2723 domain-containing protein [Candidatus Eremiobacteraeota bacterium]|nr:DUF2723 domain-containing protein [Candidatus Eremiobacteraeota bacterium]